LELTSDELVIIMIKFSLASKVYYYYYNPGRY